MRILPAILIAVSACLQAQARTPLRDLAAPLVAPLIEGRLTVGLALGVLRDGTAEVAGFGRVRKHDPAPPDGRTVYEVGSITKVFTGILLADAVHRGVVGFDDTIAKHLPDGLAVPACGEEPIRLRHLTTHTAGLPRMPPNFDAGVVDPDARYTRERLFAGLAATQLTRVPGTKYEYSNFGVGLLGQLLVDAQKAGSYEELLVARICAPLQLGDTRCEPTAAMRGRLAPPYDAAGRPRSSWRFVSMAGAGAVRSTVDDLLRFARANLAEEASPALHLAQQARSERAPGRQAVACGWHFGAEPGVLWHNGGTRGYHAFLTIDTRRRIAVVALANTTSPLIDRVARQVCSAVLGQPVEPITVRRPVDVPVATLQRYAGRYRLGPRAEFDVRVEDGVLTAQLSGQRRQPLLPASATRFFFRGVRAEIEFTVAEGGDVTQLTLFQNGRERTAPRLR